jgi:BlaI family transcriptional regulator, penicillinase repressor
VNKPPKQLTRLELQIMKVLWDSGPSSVQVVQDNLPTPPKLAYTTVQTMLNVLHRKGWVKRTLHGRAYEYEPLLSRDRAASNAIRDMIDRLFGGSVEGLLMSLVKSKQLHPKRLEKLRTLLEEQERNEKGDHHGND